MMLTFSKVNAADLLDIFDIHGKLVLYDTILTCRKHLYPLEMRVCPSMLLRI